MPASPPGAPHEWSGCACKRRSRSGRMSFRSPSRFSPKSHSSRKPSASIVKAGAPRARGTTRRRSPSFRGSKPHRRSLARMNGVEARRLPNRRRSRPGVSPRRRRDVRRRAEGALGAQAPGRLPEPGPARDELSPRPRRRLHRAHRERDRLEVGREGARPLRDRRPDDARRQPRGTRRSSGGRRRPRAVPPPLRPRGRFDALRRATAPCRLPESHPVRAGLSSSRTRDLPTSAIARRTGRTTGSPGRRRGDSRRSRERSRSVRA